MASSDTEIKVKVDAQGAVTVFDSLNKKVAEIPATTKKAEEGFGSLEKKIITLNQAADLAKKGFDLAKGAFEQLGTVLERGSGVSDLKENFEKLAKSAGTTADVLLNRLRSATVGVISDFDLLRGANEKLRAGLKPDQLIAIADAARVLSEERAKPLTEVFEQLSEAMLSGSTRALKLAGVYVNVDDKIQQLNVSLGEHGRKLSDIEEIQIRQNAINEAYIKIGEGANKITLDAGDRVGQLATQFTNLKDRFSESLASNTAINDQLERLKNIIATTDFDRIINGLAAMTKAFNDVVIGIGLADDAVTEFADFLYKTFTPSGAEAAAELERLKKKVGENTDILKTGVLTTKDYVKEQKELATTSKSNQDIIQKTVTGVTDYAKAQELAKKRQAELSQEIKKAAEEFKKYQQTAAALNSPEGVAGLRDKFKDLYQLFKEGVIPTVAKLNEELQKTAERSLEAGASIESVGSAAALAKKDIEDAADSAYSFGDALQTGIAAGLDSILSGDFKGGLRDIGSSVLGSIGGEFLGPIGEQLGASLGDALGKAVFDGLAHVFSGRDGEGKIRDSLDALFADLLKDNPAQIFINGVQQSLSDLDFGRFTDQFNNGTFDDALAGAAANVQEAFNAVGTAFESLVPGAEAVSGQLAAILFNNVGGSLENLQVLVQSTGKSFEDLADQIVQAFYSGKISVEDAARSIIELNNLLADDIPNALGAVDVAFNNLQNALAQGGTGGRYLTNAIIALGKEANQLGLKTIPQLADVLVNKFGFSTQLVAQFLQALSASGIGSLDQLANASAQAAIVIGGNLQAITEGKAPIGAAPSSSISAPTSSGGSRSFGGSSSAINQANQSRQQQFNSIEQLIAQTDAYKTSIARLNAGLITNAQAMQSLAAIEDQATKIVREHDALQEKINKRLDEGKNVTDQMRLRLEQLNEQMKTFGKSSDSSSKTLINSGLLDFVQKFGSDMNLVEIAAKAAGVAFEKLGDAADKAFLSGKSTFQEARKSLESSNSLGSAFDTLINSGTRGGAISLDALKDIGARTLASGGKTFDDLANKALSEGVSRDTVQKLLIAIKNQGISTLDQLANASTDTGIRILAGLQDIAFPFKETSDAVLQLLDDISKIPDSKDVDVRLNLSAGNISPAIQKLLDALGIAIDQVAPGYGDATDSKGTGRGKDNPRHKRRRPRNTHTFV